MSAGAGGSPERGWGPQAVTAVRPAGGLAEEVDEKVLHAAFIPFGDITDIQIPLDYETGAWLGERGLGAGLVPAVPARGRCVPSEHPLGAERVKGGASSPGRFSLGGDGTGRDPTAAGSPQDLRVFAARDRLLLSLSPEKHRGFAFIEFELAEVRKGQRLEPLRPSSSSPGVFGLDPLPVGDSSVAVGGSRRGLPATASDCSRAAGAAVLPF